MHTPVLEASYENLVQPEATVEALDAAAVDQELRELLDDAAQVIPAEVKETTQLEAKSKIRRGGDAPVKMWLG